MKMESIAQAPPKPRFNHSETVAIVYKTEHGHYPSSKVLSSITGLSTRASDNAIRTLRSLDAGVTFTKAQQAHIEARLRMLDREREATFEERVRVTMLERNKAYLGGLEQLERQAREQKELYDSLVNRHQPIFTIEEYKRLLMVAHPDSKPSLDTLNDVFMAVKERELQLIGRKL